MPTRSYGFIKDVELRAAFDLMPENQDFRFKPMSADHNRMKTSTIGHDHHLIRGHSPTI
jgi:hypothetical protein